MKFNKAKVRKIAIDIDNKEQLYLSSSAYDYEIMMLLKGMGYNIDLKELLYHSKHHIYIINTFEKTIFRSRGNVLAQALSQGARLLRPVDLMSLIDFWFKDKYSIIIIDRKPFKIM